jgi:hypothetical protein
VTAAESIDWPDDALDRLATHLTGGALQVADIVIYHDPSHPWKNANDGHLCLVLREPMPHLDGMATLWDLTLDARFYARPDECELIARAAPVTEKAVA